MKALVMALATTRLTQLVVEDEITDPVRRKITDLNRTGRPTIWSWVDEGINCPTCMSVWAGGGILVAERIPFGRFLVRVLALSQAALIVKSMTERIDR